MKSSTKRMLSLVIVLAMALSMLPMMVFAETPTTLYVKPNDNWKIDNARFAAVLATKGWAAQVWVDATDADGDGVYEVAVPADGNAYEIVIFCRMNPNAAANGWNNKWNQTADLDIPTDGTNCYVVADGTWDKGKGQWVEYTTDGGMGETEPTTASPIQYSVAGESALCGSNWNPDDINNMMLDEDNDGVYSITYKNVAAGTYQFKVTDGSWNKSWGKPNSTDNYVLTLEATAETVEICFDTATELIEVVIDGEDPTEPSTEPSTEPEPGVATYYVIGSFNDWALKDQAYAMKDEDGDGIYSLTFAVKAGEVALKVNNGTWDDGCSWGDNGNNITGKASADCDITVTFDPATGVVTVEGLGAGDPLVIDSVHVVGAEGLTGFDWKPAENMMTNTDGVYEITFENVAAGTYEFKFAANGTWDINWASGGLMESGVVYDTWFNAMGNSSVTVAANGSTVTLKLDLTTMDPISGEGSKSSVEIVAGGVTVSGAVATGNAGDATVELLNGEDVVATATASDAYSFENVAAGTYTLKVSKLHHVTREYTVTVADEAVTQDVKIHMIGDIDGIGSANMGDISIMYAHIKGTVLITDEYKLLVADVSGDALNMGDFAALYAHIKGTVKLY